MKLAEKISQNSANSSNRKIALFGGSFDPITRGHQCVIDIILKNNIVDEIWLLPCYRHLFGKQLTSDAHRLNMLNIAVKDYKNVFVIDYEIEKKLQGSTYGLLLSLRSEPGTDIYGFSVIIGLDNALCIKKWHNFEKLVHMAQFITMHRPGIIEDPQINWYLKSPHIFINDKALINCSSTIVRETIKNSDPCLIKNLLNEAVYDYIIDNKLYLLNKESHRYRISAHQFLKRARTCLRLSGYPESAQVDRPALIEGTDGTKLWHLNGEWHRTDGPAVEDASGYKAWYLNGTWLPEDLFLKLTGPVKNLPLYLGLGFDKYISKRLKNESEDL